MSTPAAEPSLREQRRLQRVETRQREIVGVADALFAVHGYDGTSLERIAAGSGYSVGAIYKFFPSKDAVYSAVLERHSDILVERLLACAAAEGTGMDKVLAMASAAVETLREFPDHARMSVSNLESPARKGSFRKILETYAAAIAEGQADGTIDTGPPRHLAQYVGGLVLAQTQTDPAISGDPDGIPLEQFLRVVKRALAPEI